jgi:UDP-2-acetamido-2,6-beta-L-arabino-hexul-4-ose reductase
MIKVGITGKSGFIGTHLYNFLNTKKDSVELIPFEDAFFNDQGKLERFVGSCDTIVHLAAMNRHNDASVIYETNIWLVKKIILALEKTKSRAHIIFSSSSQEERDNLYGKSKKDGRNLFIEWANKNNAIFTGLIIPNVFGPFGNPYYNSVIATFCHQLAHNETPKIEIDGLLKLIYVGELVSIICRVITGKIANTGLIIEHTSEKKVSELLFQLELFKAQYFENGNIPKLNCPFDINLFNTFRCYFDLGKYFPFPYKKNSDERGDFVEIMRTEIGGQFSFSTTKPGITRGNHYHTRKIERFSVIKGEAIIKLRRIGNNEVFEYKLSGDNPSFVDMPIWFTHNITNVGDTELYTLFWINEFYNPEDPDTFFEHV